MLVMYAIGNCYLYPSVLKYVSVYVNPFVFQKIFCTAILALLAKDNFLCKNGKERKGKQKLNETVKENYFL